jgi:hypothetical protein
MLFNFLLLQGPSITKSRDISAKIGVCVGSGYVSMYVVSRYIIRGSQPIENVSILAKCIPLTKVKTLIGTGRGDS